MHICLACLILFGVTGLTSSRYLSHGAKTYRRQSDPHGCLLGRDEAHSLAKDRKPWKDLIVKFSVTEEKSGEERHMLHDSPKQHKCTLKALISFGTGLTPIMLSHTFLCGVFKPQ